MTEHREVASYSYVSEDGSPIYEVVRLEPKSFRQRRIMPDGSKEWGLASDTPRPLYRLPSVVLASEVFYVEGERDVHTLERCGLCATTSSGGAGAPWQESWTEALSSKHVVLIPDNDEPGRRRADEIVDQLLGNAASMAVVLLPAPSKDVTDFLERDGGTPEELNKLIEVARLPENSPVRKLRELIRRKGNPAAIQSEKLVLGAVMEGKVPFTEIDLLDQMDFHVHAHRKIYSAIKDLNQKSGATDLKSVIQELEEREQLDEIGGMTYLVELTDDLPAVFDVDSHLETIKRKTAGRELLDDLTKASNNLIVGADPDEVKAILAGSLDKDVVASKSMPTSTVPEIISSFKDFFQKREPGILCEPINDVMQSCYGFQEGQLVIIGGRPSSGKSSLATLIAAYAAKTGHATDIISLEISKSECLLKMISMIAKVPMLDIYAGRIDDYQRERLQMATKVFMSMPLRIDDGAGWNIGKIRGYFKRRRAAGQPIRLLILDYLQLVQGGRADGRRDLELGLITRGLKLIAKEFLATIVVLSQLNRDGDKMNRKPQLSDLRDSGSIEADADIVLLCHQNLADDHVESPERDAFILMAKSRNGSIGEFEVKFSKPFTFFYSPKIKQAPDYAKLLPLARRIA